MNPPEEIEKRIWMKFTNIVIFVLLCLIAILIININPQKIVLNNTNTIQEIIIYNTSYKMTCPSITIPEYKCPAVYCPSCVHDTFSLTIQGVAETHSYTADVYDCTEYSKETNRRLKEMGWRSSIINVNVDCDSGLFEEDICEKFNGRHEIVKVQEIYIEAVDGVIIDPQNYEDYGIIYGTS